MRLHSRPESLFVLTLLAAACGAEATTDTELDPGLEDELASGSEEGKEDARSCSRLEVQQSGPSARQLLVAIEGGGVVALDPASGAIQQRYATGSNAFGVVYTPDGRRAFVTDKDAGTLSEIDPGSDAVLSSVAVGAGPQQPVLAGSRVYVSLSGGAGIAVVDVSGAPALVRKIETGAGSKPHILSVSPDGRRLWATVQGIDPRVLSIELTPEGEGAVRDYRYDLVPRVIHATNDGAYFTAHHSTGLHHVNGADGAVSTPYMDTNGPHSEARKQIEGVVADEGGGRIGITHEGKRSMVVLARAASGGLRKVRNFYGLSASPYWVSFDPSARVAYVSIPGSGTVQAYDLRSCSRRPLWTASVGGKPKRMTVTAQ